MHNYKAIKELARELRKNSTKSEKLLWERLRDRRLNVYKFLRQHPIVYGSSGGRIDFFIADFYCASKRLVIEVDGGIHDIRKGYDEQRDLIMKAKGIRVLRIRNEDLRDMEEVLERIKRELDSPPESPSLFNREGERG